MLRNLFALNGKTAIVTGASYGLGVTFAEALAEAGANVVLSARSGAKLEDVARRITGRGGSALGIPCDVGEPGQVSAMVSSAWQHFGRVDVLVNNAGYGNVSPVEDTPLADFRAQIETNLFGVIIMTKAVLPYLRERASGHIIQISSIGGRVGPTGRAAYAAAKFGVEGFSESLSKEVGPLGIKVTIIEPGGFRTHFAGSSSELREGRPEYDATVGATVRFQRNYDGKQPGDPLKAAAAILHIASLPEPPLRLLLGSDAYSAAEKNALQILASDTEWKDLSTSTDYKPPALT